MEFCSGTCLAGPRDARCRPVAPRRGRCVVEAAREGDALARESVFSAISSIAFHQALRLCRNVEDARDIAQSSLIQVFEKFDQLRDAENLRPWLRTIVLNSFRMSARQRMGTPRRFEALSENLPAPCQHVGSRIDAGRILESVFEGIGRLPPPLKSVFELRVVGGRSSAEAAIELGISEENVRTRLARARRALRRAIAASVA